MQGVPDPKLRKEYRRRLWRLLKVRRDPGLILIQLIKSAMHYHAHTMAKEMASGRTAIMNSY